MNGCWVVKGLDARVWLCEVLLRLVVMVVVSVVPVNASRKMQWSPP